jgi:hypothetical protein
MTGSIGFWDKPTDLLLAKTDAKGNILWNKTFGGQNDDGGYSVQPTNDGGYIIAGSTNGITVADKGLIGSDLWLIKTDANGGILWEKIFGGSGANLARSIRQTQESGYIIAGYTGYTTTSGMGHAWLIKTHSEGNKLWDKTFGDGERYCGVSAQQTRDGGFIMGGFRFSDLGQYKSWLMKVDNAGNKLWDRILGNSDYDVLTSLCQTDDGGYIISGESREPAGWLIKTDIIGNELWTKTFDENEIHDVQPTSDHGYIAAGVLASRTKDQKGTIILGKRYLCLIKTDANGNKLWDKTIGEGEANSIRQTNDGGFIITGQVEGCKIILIKTDANGNVS